MASYLTPKWDRHMTRAGPPRIHVSKKSRHIKLLLKGPAGRELSRQRIGVVDDPAHTTRTYRAPHAKGALTPERRPKKIGAGSRGDRSESHKARRDSVPPTATATHLGTHTRRGERDTTTKSRSG